jgi:hypothetical protein
MSSLTQRYKVAAWLEKFGWKEYELQKPFENDTIVIKNSFELLSYN